ncbi:MAG: MBL fold metallo-hydrolase [Dehalococcoidia bacterium]|nr:MBL fold metallo-hydrolase [Dehalococcoidia bacterium]
MTQAAKGDKLEIERLEMGPYGTNAYVLVCGATRDSILIDAPADPGRLVALLEKTHPKQILITHSHMDHTGALAELRSLLKVPVAAHHLDAGSLPLAPDVLLADGDAVTFGRVSLKVLHTPGHTPGSLCFLTGKHLLCGDTIFPGGPGKSNSPADLRRIIDSIGRKILVLPDDTLLYPGHGASTVLGTERPQIAAFSSRPHAPGLCGDVLWLSS